MTLLYIVLLLAANAFFVAAEFALVKVPTVRLESLAAEGGATARMTLRIANNLETYLAACQLGITMASLGLGWIGEPAVAAMLEPLFVRWGLSEHSLHIVSFLTGFILFSALHIVVGEQVPKTYAIRKADKVALWIAYPLHLAYLATYPLTWLLNLASVSILRLIGVEQVSHAEVLSGAELQGVIDVSKEHGAIEEGHAQMMQNLFRFHDRPVERIMLPRQLIEYLDINTSRDDLINAMANTHHSRLAVIDNSWENFRGVVLVKELMLSLVQDEAQQPLLAHRDIVREPYLVPVIQPVAELFKRMQADRNHIAFAVDEYSEIRGLITMEDLLEEIVGEIADESDEPEPDGQIIDNETSWTCAGLTLLGDLERVVGIQFDDQLDANTVSGLFMLRLSRLPQAADELVESGYRFSIIAMKGRQPIVVEIKPEPDEAELPPMTLAAAAPLPTEDD